MKIFFVGHLTAQYTTSRERCQTFKELGHEVYGLDQHNYFKVSLTQTIVKRTIKKFIFDKRAVFIFNQKFLDELIAYKPEIAWIEKSLLLLPETLEKARKLLPNCIFVCFQEDDPFSPMNAAELPVWENFINAIPLYDIHFVWREFNIKEFVEHGAKNVYLYMHGYYKNIFHPIIQKKDDFHYKHDVLFVGTARDQRKSDIYNLIIQDKIPVSVYGERWNRTLVYYLQPNLFHPPIFSKDYVEMIWHSKISLGYLCAANRDEFTLRTFEIPACKGFFLAQRTDKHLEIYEEGKEAEFFSSHDECADKIRFYLKNEEARKKIAEAGYERCIKSGYSLHDRLSKALEQVKLFLKY